MVSECGEMSGGQSIRAGCKPDVLALLADVDGDVKGADRKDV